MSGHAYEQDVELLILTHDPDDGDEDADEDGSGMRSRAKVAPAGARSGSLLALLGAQLLAWLCFFKTPHCLLLTALLLFVTPAAFVVRLVWKARKEGGVHRALFTDYDLIPINNNSRWFVKGLPHYLPLMNGHRALYGVLAVATLGFTTPLLLVIGTALADGPALTVNHVAFDEPLSEHLNAMVKPEYIDGPLCPVNASSAPHNVTSSHGQVHRHCDWEAYCPAPLGTGEFGGCVWTVMNYTQHQCIADLAFTKSFMDIGVECGANGLQVCIDCVLAGLVVLLVLGILTFTRPENPHAFNLGVRDWRVGTPTEKAAPKGSAALREQVLCQMSEHLGRIFSVQACALEWSLCGLVASLCSVQFYFMVLTPHYIYLPLNGTGFGEATYYFTPTTQTLAYAGGQWFLMLAGVGGYGGCAFALMYMVTVCPGRAMAICKTRLDVLFQLVLEELHALDENQDEDITARGVTDIWDKWIATRKALTLKDNHLYFKTFNSVIIAVACVFVVMLVMSVTSAINMAQQFGPGVPLVSVASNFASYICCFGCALALGVLVFKAMLIHTANETQSGILREHAFNVCGKTGIYRRLNADGEEWAHLQDYLTLLADRTLESLGASPKLCCVNITPGVYKSTMGVLATLGTTAVVYVVQSVA